MAQTPTTLIGNLTEEPSLQFFEKNQTYKARFRIASSRRTRDKNNPEIWNDSDLLYIDVEVWGPLALNCKKSLTKGMPVLVHGSLFTDEWEVKGTDEKRQVVRLRGYSVGLDLNRYVIASQRIEAAEKNLIGAALPAHVDPASLCDRIHPDKENGNEDNSSVFGPPPEPVVEQKEDVPF
ncbi:MAG: single-stranded DNA-binding protein [Corynebacterium sp.]|uniref:single-stranded DNA-binding protein n=1 Tax=Corynebacterium sp. TaxID=1720 RepID=UPI0026DF8CD2|nr:single-stranded DNA-binding protein [Corynebacterium sp.]MDO5669058.1 single-stranded DNA-binding protein [Corynebacterium sp.]